MNYILTTENLTKIYGQKKAANNINIHIREGSIYGLIGRNGAGKTTVMRMISGLSKPTGGSYQMHGEHRFGVGVLIESPGIYPNMSAEENLRLKCIAMGCYKKDYVQQLLSIVGLSDTGKKHAGSFSLGMRQRLGIALALVGDPKMIVLDEPINGLDPQGIMEVREMILRLNKEKGITILISSHILDELSRLATHYGFVERGRVIKEMSAEELEAACRTAVHLSVNDTKLLAGVLDGMGAEYRIYSPNEADIFSPVQVTPLVLALNEKNCFVNSMTERHESLESYFMGLVGGVRNV